jgi:hypothetical protein
MFAAIRLASLPVPVTNHNDVRLMSVRRRKAVDEIEHSLVDGCDLGTVLASQVTLAPGIAGTGDPCTGLVA